MNKLTLFKLSNSATSGFCNNAIIDGIDFKHVDKGIYFDAEQAEFIVTACNSYEANKNRIAEMEAEKQSLINTIKSLLPAVPAIYRKQLKDLLVKEVGK
jgi:hypothetical protein